MLGSRVAKTIIALIALLLGGCADFIQQSHAVHDLDVGVQYYEEGNYPAAIEFIQHSLKDGLHYKSDMVRAYKYIAFIQCISEREKQCRDAFKKALEIDPDLELQAAEAGHPIWGPVFRSVKGKPAK